VRRIPLTGFGDAEAVEYISPGTYVISDEYNQRLIKVHIADSTLFLDSADAEQLTLGIDAGGNSGFEGLAYDNQGQRLFVAKERKPVQIIEVRGFPNLVPGSPNVLEVTSSKRRDAGLFTRRQRVAEQGQHGSEQKRAAGGGNRDGGGRDVVRGERAESVLCVQEAVTGAQVSWLRSLQGFHAFLSAQQQQVSRTCREQAVGDHADDGVDLGFELHRVGDAHVMNVEDDVAVVGQHAFAVHRVAAQFHQFAGNVAAGHRDDFDRQRERTQYGHQLAAVCNADERLGHSGHDLLAGQGCAATFDQVQVLVAF
nr:hypothetical protein [Tanacetum cinerariifolium]